MFFGVVKQSARSLQGQRAGKELEKQRKGQGVFRVFSRRDFVLQVQPEVRDALGRCTSASELVVESEGMEGKCVLTC